MKLALERKILTKEIKELSLLFFYDWRHDIVNHNFKQKNDASSKNFPMQKDVSGQA